MLDSELEIVFHSSAKCTRALADPKRAATKGARSHPAASRAMPLTRPGLLH